MKKPGLNRDTLPYFVEGLERIVSLEQRQWGTLTPAGLMTHLRVLIEISLGERRAEDKSVPIVRHVIRILFFEWFTDWPGGKIKVPDSLTPPPDEDLEAERTALVSAMERFVAALEADPERKTPTVALGPQTLRYQAHIHGLHFHHHFKQYGVL